MSSIEGKYRNHHIIIGWSPSKLIIVFAIRSRLRRASAQIHSVSCNPDCAVGILVLSLTVSYFHMLSSPDLVTFAKAKVANNVKLEEQLSTLAAAGFIHAISSNKFMWWVFGDMLFYIIYLSSHASIALNRRAHDTVRQAAYGEPT